MIRSRGCTGTGERGSRVSETLVRAHDDDAARPRELGDYDRGHGSAAPRPAVAGG
jgi:hypothetical protein